MRLTIALVLAVAVRVGEAAAYPELSGTRTCAQCHADDGLRLGPAALGADVRLAAMLHDHAFTEARVFPMQAEASLAAELPRVTLFVLGGLGRDAALVSREHWARYEAEGRYLQAGRFHPRFGLGGEDHTAYVRRYTGLGLLEEPYALAAGSRDVQVAFFDRGVSAAVARRPWGLHARATTDRLWIGAALIRGAGDLVVVAELDGGAQRAGGGVLAQVAAFAGVYRPVGRAILGAAVHAHDPDLALEDSGRAAGDVTVRWLPTHGLEVHVLGRVEAVALDLDHPDLTALLQLHAYL